MYPSQIRAQIQTSQQALLDELTALEEMSRAPCPLTAPQLRARIAALVPALLTHIQLDDRILAPALEETDAWRALRLRRLQQHHEHQAEGIIQIIQQLTDDAPDEQLHATIQQVSAALRADFAEEAALLLSPEVLRDDLITVAAGA